MENKSTYPTSAKKILLQSQIFDIIIAERHGMTSRVKLLQYIFLYSRKNMSFWEKEKSIIISSKQILMSVYHLSIDFKIDWLIAAKTTFTANSIFGLFFLSYTICTWIVSGTAKIISDFPLGSWHLLPDPIKSPRCWFLTEYLSFSLARHVWDGWTQWVPSSRPRAPANCVDTKAYCLSPREIQRF